MKDASWVVVEGEPIPLKEAYTHDSASTVDRTMATLHHQSSEAILGRSHQHTQQNWEDFLGRLSVEALNRYLGVREYERSPKRTDARNGFYVRDFVARLDTLRVRVARTQRKLPLIRDGSKENFLAQ